MSKLRIAIGQIWQEQNTFSPVKTTIKDFEQFGLLYEDEILEKFSEVNELGGFISCLKSRKDIEIIPTVRAWSWPKGNLESSIYYMLRDEMISHICKALPLDGVLISFHGAMVSDVQPDVEGDILECIRKETGNNIPIAVSCDLHANITMKMLTHSDYIEGYHTCPHIDLFRTGKKAADILLELLVNNKRLEPGFVKLPLITPARAHDSKKGPFKSLFTKIEEMENKNGIKGASLFPVQPWLDVPELGWSVLVYSDKEKRASQSQAERLAKYAWDIKEEFFLDELSPSEAIEEARSMKKGLMVVSDSDATTAGAPGDNTVILEELLKSNIDFPVLVCFIDPEIVNKSIELGIGNDIRGMIGGKMDNIFCNPLQIEGTVKNITDGRFEINGHAGKNHFDMGKMAVIESGHINILAAEKNGPFFEKTVYETAGLDPRDYRMLVVKSPVGFRYAFEDTADRIGIVMHPGLSSSNLKLFNFRKVPRPLYPLDEIEDLKI